MITAPSVKERAEAVSASVAGKLGRENAAREESISREKTGYDWSNVTSNGWRSMFWSIWKQPKARNCYKLALLYKRDIKTVLLQI